VRIVANEVKKLTKDPPFAYKAPMMQKSSMKHPETQRKALGRCSEKRVGLKQALEKAPFFINFQWLREFLRNTHKILIHEVGGNSPSLGPRLY